jgi:DNA-binding transcriptional ArsR family regulator
MDKVGTPFGTCTHQQFYHDRSVVADPDIVRIAGTIGDPTRIRMLTLLMDGRALTAKELAYGAGVAPATATTHLRRLLSDTLVLVRAQGRHKYFQLASPQVARCVESLLVLAPEGNPVLIRTPHPLREARFCYDHLAGKLAVQITRALINRRQLVRQASDFVPTKKGEALFAGLGIDLVGLKRSRRKFAPACMDWSERKDHVGGVLGATLAQTFLEHKWIKRSSHTRAVSVTTAGATALEQMFGLENE